MERSQERLESLKAGSVAGVGVAAIAILFQAANAFLVAKGSPLPLLELAPLPAELIDVAIAAISGFLFGVTYRYAVRDAQDPQLKSGVVAAFGLVRGLAQLETGLRLEICGWQLALLAGESMAMMAIAALLLDLALSTNWISPAK